MVNYKAIQTISVKKGNNFGLFFLFFLFCFCQCKPDFSVNSDSEPFPVVYGLLNVSEEQHYVKIFKSFVVEGNAYDAVNDIDNYSYRDQIEVYINEYDAKNNLIRKIRMDTTTSIAKDSGLFAYPTQILYTAKATLNKNYLYEIEVFNPQTKNIAKAKAPVAVVGDVRISRPSAQDISITDNGMRFEFYSGENTNMYQLLLKYYYTEDYFDGTSKQPKPVIWDLGNIVDLNGTAGTLKSLPVSTGAYFFKRIAEKVLEDENVKARHTDSIVMEVHSAGKDWGLYIQSNLPSSGINQDRLHYTNIIAYNSETNEQKYATGVFSTRGITTRKFNNLILANGSRDSLFYGRYTGHLKFTDIY